MRHFILGGARSGKSRYAEALAVASGRQLFYLATAEALDPEMNQRIARHRRDRDPTWQLVEEPLLLGSALQELDKPDHCILIDCLTLWLSNCLHADVWAQQRALFLDAMELEQAELILVSNEVGNGIIPLGELSRQFVDESGWLHQAVASRCERVTTIIAGLPLHLKGD